MKLVDLRPDDVVITGRGVVSPIGNDATETLLALRDGRSGIAFEPEFAERGFRSCVAGRVRHLNAESYFSRLRMMSMSKVSLYSSIAAVQAVRESGLEPSDCERELTGVILGCGIGGLGTNYKTYEKFKAANSPRRVGGHGVDTTMASTCTANASVLFKNKGLGESLSSACATGLQSIGYAYRMIRHGYLDTAIAGSADEDGWETAFAFDGMRVLCCDSNEGPERASRPFDATRSGFVPAGGAGAVVLESYARAAQRNARPLARIAGYWSCCDGSGDMTAPTLEGQLRVIRHALRTAALEPRQIDYVNLHGTSTRVGDDVELTALGQALGAEGYLASSSKSQTGHTLAASGAIEVVLTSLMLEQQFVAPSINLERLDPQHAAFDSVLARRPTERALRYVMTNSFGFGNTNASMILEAIEH